MSLASDSFIDDYLLATEGNESPRAYHLWSCMSTMAVASGRRFWFKLGRLRYYPNLYILLVGDPGVKKSTAMDFAKDLIRHTGICPMTASQTTKEAIGKMMSHKNFKGRKEFNINGTLEEYNQLAIFATEFTQFISINPEGMLEFLTSIYTEKVHATDFVSRDPDLVIHPNINLLGCLTPDMLKGYIKLNVLTGGFARRTVFVYGFRERLVAIPPEVDPKILARLYAWISLIQQHSGEFIFGPGAEDWYTNWYETGQRNLTEVSKPNTESYYRTKQEILFKISMMIALSESKGQARQLLPAHFEFAEKRFFAPVEKHLEKVFTGAGVNPESSVAQKMCAMLEKLNEPMSFKKFQLMFGDSSTSWRALTETIAHLEAVGRLRKVDVYANGNFVGQVIGTPDAISRYLPADLAKFL